MTESKLTLLSKKVIIINDIYRSIGTYQCECGTVKDIRIDMVKGGKVVSCGCYNKQKLVTHGLTGQPLFKAWQAIIDRCYNEKSPAYQWYGARGIIMCDEWLNDPQAFVDWGMANGWKEGLETDRKDNDGIYSPSNCRFVTPKVNCNNRTSNVLITYNGRTQTAMQWSEEMNVEYHLIINRIKKWPTSMIFIPSTRMKGYNKRETERAVKRKLKKLSDANQ